MRGRFQRRGQYRRQPLLLWANRISIVGGPIISTHNLANVGHAFFVLEAFISAIPFRIGVAGVSLEEALWG